jgi:DNA-binding winged helix-turn-helix (wHTH) protein
MNQNHAENRVVVFGYFWFDTSSYELCKNGIKIQLEPKPAIVLSQLLKNAGGLVTREDLQEHLWPNGECVDFNHGLNKSINRLRAILGDEREHPRYIETLSGRGYRFICPVEQYFAPTVTTSSEASCHESKESEEIASESTSISEPPPLHPFQIGQKLGASSPKALGARLKVSLVAGISLLLMLFVLVLLYRPGRLLAESAGYIRPVVSAVVINEEGALNPVDIGFKIRSIGRYDADVMRNSNNFGFDRWKIVSDDQMYYYHTLTAVEKQFASSHDWRLICTCAVQVGAAWVNIDLGKGERRFDIELLRESDKYFVGLTQQISPAFEFASKIEFEGVSDVEHPHTFELRYDHVSKTASLWIDNFRVATGYRGHSQFVQDNGLIFGSGSYLTSRTGIGIFRSVRFEALVAEK